MKSGFLAGAAIAMADAGNRSGRGAGITTNRLLEKVVDRTPDQTWAKIGPYCSIAPG